MAGEFARQVGPSVGQSLGLLGRDTIIDWRAANRFGRHQVGPYRERTHRCLMRSYAANGNRAKAVATYHEFRELLAYDVGTGPELETEVLYLRS